MPNPEPLTQQQIDSLRELYERTTRGERRVERGSNGATVWAQISPTGSMQIAAYGHAEYDHANAECDAAAHNAMPALLETLEERNADCGCGPHKHRSDTETGAARECLECECKQFYNVHMLVEALRADLQQKEAESVAERRELTSHIVQLIEQTEAQAAELQQLRKFDAQSRKSGCWCDEYGHPCKACEDKQQLTRELQRANERVAELEAELDSLKPHCSRGAVIGEATGVKP